MRRIPHTSWKFIAFSYHEDFVLRESGSERVAGASCPTSHFWNLRRDETRALHQELAGVLFSAQNKLDWLEAVRSRDPALIQKAQTNILMRRAGLATPALTSDRNNPSATPFAAGGETPLASYERAVPPKRPAASAPPMGLDEFVHKHTSEDNASFETIMAREEARKRAKFAHLWNPKGLALPAPDKPATEGLPAPPAVRMLRGPGDVGEVSGSAGGGEGKELVRVVGEPVNGDAAGTRREEPRATVMGGYKALNTLYYDGGQRTSLALSEKEKALRVQVR